MNIFVFNSILINLYHDIILTPRLTFSLIVFMFNLDEKMIKLASFGLNYAHVVVLHIYGSFYWENEISADVRRKDDQGDEFRVIEGVRSKLRGSDLAWVSCTIGHERATPGL